MIKLLLSKFAMHRIEKFEPDFLIGKDRGDPYLKRWYLFPRNKFFNVYVHEFQHSDEDRVMHDHPWPSLSLMIQGCMIEHYKKLEELSPQMRLVSEGDWTFRPPKFAHRLDVVHEKLCGKPITVFITGPRVRNWGFHCPKGWVDFESYASSGGCGEEK